MLTTRLNRFGGFALVLAKPYKGQPSACTFANIKQAEAAAAKLRANGTPCHVRTDRRPFYVIIEEN